MAIATTFGAKNMETLIINLILVPLEPPLTHYRFCEIKLHPNYGELTSALPESVYIHSNWLSHQLCNIHQVILVVKTTFSPVIRIHARVRWTFASGEINSGLRIDTARYW